MKKIVILFLVCAALLAGAQAQADPNPAKTRALALREELIVLSRTPEVEQSAWDAVGAHIDGYQKEYGVTDATSNNVALLRKFQLSIARKFPDQTRYRALLDQLAKDPVPAVAKMATEQLEVVRRLEDLKTKPVYLKFTASDGTPVDLATMRGKVVVVDFWASWCPECAFTAKDLAEVYRNLHGQGLEVVGVSLDEDRTSMEAFAKKYGMTWPNSFEGKKWDNPISRSYGISSLPTLWLIDKKGMLVANKEPKNLAAEVKRLLAEP